MNKMAENEPIIYIDILPAIIQMSKDQQLQQKLRSSSALTEKDVYLDFMVYASQVKDEMEVLLYMQENSIGIDQADYWLARFDILQKRCQLTKIVNLIKKVRLNHQIQQTWKIDQFQKVLLKEMEVIINTNFRGKRTPKQFQRLSAMQIHPKKRKIGNIQVYVDPSCRPTYKLEDYAKFIEDKMSDYCTIEREDYSRNQDKKPLSFIAKNEIRLMELTHQILAKTSRPSAQDRGSLGAKRISNKINLPEPVLFQPQNYHTPKNHQNQNSKRTSVLQKKKSSSRDSVQILRSMKKHQSGSRPKSPKFKSSVKILQKSPEKLPQEVERCRSVANQTVEYFGFSFGKNLKQSLKSQKKSPRHSRLDDSNVLPKENAIQFNSFNTEKKEESSNLQLVKKEDFQLQLIIQQIQRENYELVEARTLSSEIDSNQQNNDYLNVDARYSFANRHRKPFQIILDRTPEQHRPPQQPEPSIGHDEYRNPEETPMFHDLSEDAFRSTHKNKYLRQSIFLSERQKRLSSISEQASNYYSESKNTKNR